MTDKIREDIRTPIRSRIRPRRTGSQGPMHVPDEVKALYPTKHMEWCGVSPDNPFTLHQKIRDGYTHVPITALEQSGVAVGDSSFINSYKEGENICMGTGPNTKAYLIMIDKSIKDEMDSDDQEDRENHLKQLTGEVQDDPHVYKHRAHKENLDLEDLK